MASSNEPAGGSPKLVLIALVLALAAVVLVNVYIGVVRSSAQPGEFTVFRLRTGLQPGDELDADDVEPVRVPDTFESAFTNAVKPQQENGDVPARVGDTIRQAGRMNDILTYRLFEERDENRLDKNIDQGKRGITLLADPKSLAGLRPGMYVDLVAPFFVDGKRRAMVVMEQVKLVSIGAQSIGDSAQGDFNASNAESIRIQVNADQVTTLTEIANMAAGPFKLPLRNPGDEGTPKLEPGRINDTLVQMLDEQTSTAEREQ
jgi:Flp pilus assembly protein CpaB